ncbi:MAG: nitrogenase iron-molybdenum cofactor biosynthesis protein NifN [Gammaproteobacteria bacterium]|nr:nitrogenase iron-molybdenum cofactor biosynthesis protein NifN [Gammaproteobacteria bacterium]MCP5425833.1 nitrogenase iron-molybdenum cofactor biosynthesis protein NifN [Gammaproteobacteria bacterium]MCP5458557.1 nitrogenase iron-molybdenum cofactor biosynthesis protein NifN [Gammaproteobacteria bacterium]
MTKIVRRSKPLSVNPLKSSQPLGATLAMLGLNRTMPILHGSQGCSAFAKVFLVRHFREPIPLQTTAMDSVSSIMGADDNLLEGLQTLCEKAKPAVIGVLTTGLSETQGADIVRVLKEFRDRHPEYQAVRILPVNTPDFSGCLETGFAAAVQAMIDNWVPNAESAGTRPGRRPRQVNVLCGALLTPGDLETLKDLIGRFGLHPVMIPDISDSLDGHLTEIDFSPVTQGGTPASAFATLGDAAATLVVGASLEAAADLLQQRTGVPDHRFDHLVGLEAVDRLVMTLAGISGQAVPALLERQRAQLQDAMLDTHFMLTQARIAVAADADLLHAFGSLLAEMGADVVAAVTPDKAPVLERTPIAEVKIGDLEDLEMAVRERGAELVIGSSHAADTAQRLGLPLLRAGFPLYDLIGGYQRTWIGYAGTRQTLFDLANILLNHNQHEIEPYHSLYSPKSDYRQEGPHHELAEASADSSWRS